MYRHSTGLVVALTAFVMSACAIAPVVPAFAPGDPPPGPDVAVVFGRIEVSFDSHDAKGESFFLNLEPAAGTGGVAQGELLGFRSGNPFYVVMRPGVYQIGGSDRPMISCTGVTFTVPEGGGAVYLGTLSIGVEWRTFAPNDIGINVRDDFDGARAAFQEQFPNFEGPMVKSLIAVPAPQTRGAATISPCRSTAGSVVFPVSIFFGF